MECIMSISTSIHDHFGDLPDPRIDRTKRHALLDIVTIAVCAVICGAESWVEIAEFGRAKQRWFQRFLSLPNGIASHDTFGRVFARLDPAAFEASFLGWVQALVSQTGGAVVAVDGKTLRRSHDRANGKAALQLVSAWATEQRVLLGQTTVAAEGSETTTIPALLALLALEDATVTIDAAGTHPPIAQQIVDQGGDYVLALKANQPTRHQEVTELFTEARATGFAGIAHDSYETVEKGHGRIERRRYWTITEPAYLAWLAEDQAWPALQSVGLVEAERRIGDEVTRETRTYLSSLPGDAPTFARAVRGHWGIENQYHWLLDVAFREDESRVRTGHAAANFGMLRRLALQLLRQETTAKIGIKAKRLKAGWDEDYLIHVLTQ
jgi:predicted transposase YbfD/YdcC